MIDYLVPQFFLEITASGGMHTKVARVRRASSSLYQMHVGSDLGSMRSAFLLIEPLYFRMEKTFDLSELAQHPAKKILYCSEMEVFRWTGSFRKELLGICDVVTCNCDYQASLFSAVSIENPIRLIDPISEDDFVPGEKRLKLVSLGRISEIKGSPFIAELFKLLSPLPVETAYIGGASLWGEASEVDAALETEIREHADVFHQNILPEFVPKALADSTYFTGAAIHDVFSSSHAEALMSGCVSVSGEHPIYAERPGFSGNRTPEAIVERMAKQTRGFTRMPDKRMGIASREWALKNCSFEVFRTQLVNLLGSLYDK